VSRQSTRASLAWQRNLNVASARADCAADECDKCRSLADKQHGNICIFRRVARLLKSPQKKWVPLILFDAKLALQLQFKRVIRANAHVLVFCAHFSSAPHLECIRVKLRRLNFDAEWECDAFRRRRLCSPCSVLSTRFSVVLFDVAHGECSQNVPRRDELVHLPHVLRHVRDELDPPPYGHAVCACLFDILFDELHMFVCLFY